MQNCSRMRCSCKLTASESHQIATRNYRAPPAVLQRTWSSMSGMHQKFLKNWKKKKTLKHGNLETHLHFLGNLPAGSCKVKPREVNPCLDPLLIVAYIPFPGVPGLWNQRNRDDAETTISHAEHHTGIHPLMICHSTLHQFLQNKL